MAFRFLSLVTAIYFSLLVSVTQAQTVRDDVGYTRLQSMLGINTPNGRGVTVGVIDPNLDGSWTPIRDRADVDLSGKTINNRSTTQETNYASSSHATQVSKWLFSNNESVASGITNANFYPLDNFTDQLIGRSNYISNNYKIAQQSGINTFEARVNNFSSIGNSRTLNGNVLRRFDWATAHEDAVNVISAGNSIQSSAIFSSSYNGVYVGITAGTSGQRSAPIDSLYHGFRQRPDVVAPMINTSRGTAVVSSIMASLYETAANPALSATGTSNDGRAIQNAQRSEVMKTIIMTGANRETNNTRFNTKLRNPDGTFLRNENGKSISVISDITDYRKDPNHRTDNGLDTRYGAGQVDTFNSHQILAAGEQDSLQDGGSATVDAFGFDYDDEFGLGVTGRAANSTASYLLPTLNSDSQLSTTLAWNLDVYAEQGAFTSAISYDLDVLLFDLTDGELEAFSISSTANTETIWQLLQAGHQYEIRVVSVKNVIALIWDYAIAWRIEDLTPSAVATQTTSFSNLQTQAVPIPAAGWLFFSGFVTLLGWKKHSQDSKVQPK